MGLSVIEGSRHELERELVDSLFTPVVRSDLIDRLTPRPPTLRLIVAEQVETPSVPATPRQSNEEPT